MMPKFRRKIFTVTAWQFDGSLASTLLIQSQQTAQCPIDIIAHPDILLRIRTPEGPLTAETNDWIIQGIHGELYPCKPDIFAQIYEAVE